MEYTNQSLLSRDLKKSVGQSIGRRDLMLFRAGSITDRCAKRLTLAELQPGLVEERTDQLGLLTQTTDRKV